MAKAPYFPFLVKDWLLSRKVLKMSGDSAKAYMYLLCEAWLSIPRATLPMDDRELASLARVSDEKWSVLKTEVLACFMVGKCEEHRGRFYSPLLLELSRKFEANQRFNNKNAKRTRIKRGLNAPLGNANASGNGNANGIKNGEGLPDRDIKALEDFHLEVATQKLEEVGIERTDG